jgi:hypothetical protein
VKCKYGNINGGYRKMEDMDRVNDRPVFFNEEDAKYLVGGDGPRQR